MTEDRKKYEPGLRLLKKVADANPNYQGGAKGQNTECYAQLLGISNVEESHMNDIS